MPRVTRQVKIHNAHFELEMDKEFSEYLDIQTTWKDEMPLGLMPIEELKEPSLTEWREGQAELVSLIWILHSIPGGTRIYVDAPTGSGKSAIVRGLIALHEAGVGESRNILQAPTKAPVMVLTSDHTLQEQYNQFERFMSLTGRPNWPCTLDPTVTADKAICATGEIGRKECTHFLNGACAYYAQAEQAINNGVFVTNYHWWVQSRKNPGFDASLVICDEAHALEPILREDQTVSVALNASEPDPVNWEVWLNEQLRLQIELLDDVNQVIEKAMEEEGDAQARRMKAHRQRITRALNKTQMAINQLRDRPEDVVIHRSGNTVQFAPVRVKFSREMSLYRAIFLSATMPDPALVDNEYAILIRVPSTFPKERRPVIPLNTVRLGRSSGDEDYQKLAQEVDRRLLQHSAGKGLVHTTSFAIAEAIKKYSTNPGMLITHGPGDRDAAIAAFKAAPAGRVLLSPSAAQGVDLPYDLCSWQMIAKLPFPFLGDPVERARMAQQPKLSAQDTVLQIVQAAGRGMRAPDDNCITYIADGNWSWFYQQNEELFPPWFREAIVKNS